MKPILEIRHKLFTGIRNQIQLILFVVTMAAGFQFYLYVLQAMSTNSITVPRPEGVEGFLPIGALMSWKYFIFSGQWDTVHPASMAFLGFAILISFLLRKSFCSWFCPIGTFSEWVWKIGEFRLGKNYQLPVWLDIPFRSVKYFLLGFFVYIIFQMSVADIEEFLRSPYYRIADVKMLYFFTKMTSITAIVLLALVVLSFFTRNFWCRYACPYGALLGIFAFFSPSQIKRNPETCINCDRCNQACPYHLPVNKKKLLYSLECSGCMDCIHACPSKNTLGLKIRGLKVPIHKVQLGFLIMMIFFSMIYFSKISGHWKSSISDQEFRMLLRMMDSSEIVHPSMNLKKGT